MFFILGIGFMVLSVIEYRSKKWFLFASTWEGRKVGIWISLVHFLLGLFLFYKGL